VTALEALARALADGLTFAVRFNPLAAAVTAGVAGAVVGYPRNQQGRRRWAAALVAAGWLVGDGLRVVARARDLADGGSTLLEPGAPVWAGWLTLLLWAAGSLAIGYLLPTLAGGLVGRRVTFGIRWIAAAAVGSGLALAVSAVAATVG
jgi:hypothetical protein